MIRVGSPAARSARMRRTAAMSESAYSLEPLGIRPGRSNPARS
jgi:hypothetical protein